MSHTDNISAVLGKRVNYSSRYNPEILVRERRSRNRQQYGIADDNLKFVGYDNWNAYEISFLLNNGYPFSGIAKIVYPCTDTYLVESKSLKLYLNSFNMEKIGTSIDEAINNFEKRVTKDLSNLLETDVQVHVFYAPEASQNFWKHYESIGTHINVSKLQITQYNENPNVLQIEEGAAKVLKVSIPFLRSNCKITAQPDWGTAFIYYEGRTGINLESLAQYVISFRNENHFHEEVCEMIYTRLLEKFTPKNLMVACQYTRRGGIDINPIRATHDELIPNTFKRADEFFHRELQQ